MQIQNAFCPMRSRLRAAINTAIFCAVLLIHAAAMAETSVAGTPARYAPTTEFDRETLEGWTLRVHRGFAKNPQLKADTLKELGSQLAEIARVVPAPALAQLRKVTIWVEVAEPHHPCMCYHPDVAWLQEHHMNPDKARCVEIANAATFLKWTVAQPWMVLHELAHAYHHQVLSDGYENREILALYQRALAAGRYGDVLYCTGIQRKSYAATNQQEFFAESSEAYFGTNDFFPFVRAELRQYDPAAFEVMEKCWNKKPNPR